MGFGKQAAISIETFSVLSVLTSHFYIATLVCLALNALTWQVVLTRYPLSFAYFLMSGIFVNILLISRFIFHEQVSIGNILGATLIIAGMIVLTRDDQLKENV